MCELGKTRALQARWMDVYLFCFAFFSSYLSYVMSCHVKVKSIDIILILHNFVPCFRFYSSDTTLPLASCINIDFSKQHIWFRISTKNKNGDSFNISLKSSRRTRKGRLKTPLHVSTCFPKEKKGREGGGRGADGGVSPSLSFLSPR